MFQPWPLFVGLRYVRSRTRKFFVSFITWVSLAGVGVGVAALIVILSVMNGFEGELRERLLALSSHAHIQAQPTGANEETSFDVQSVADWQTLSAQLKGDAVEVQALALRTPEMLPIRLRGVDPRFEREVSRAAESMIAGEFAALEPGLDRVILGSVVAKLLGVGVGDRVTVLVPSVTAGGTPLPRLREFLVAGLFEIGLQDHDGTLALAHFADVAALATEDRAAFSLQLRFSDALRAPAIAAALSEQIPKGLAIRDWTQDHANYFRAIRIEKTMMALILLLIVAVAAFNIVAMLVMVVTDKRTDIAILRTLGALPKDVTQVFLTQGLVIGWGGVLIGVALGVTLAVNVGEIVPWLEAIFGFTLMDPSVYYVTRIPSELRWSQVMIVGGSALTLTTLATFYPARQAARVAPAEALRYE
jgi:lipoprotein-releasing system permease protein